MTYAFTLNREGGGEVLQQMVADHIRELALQIGQAADEGAKVKDFSQIDDHIGNLFGGKRFIATVTVPAERQAKDGALTKAAAAAGLEVRLIAAKTKQETPRRKKRAK